MEGFPPEALEQIAVFFQALAEPTRLHILNELRSGERNVSEIADAIGSSVANVSRHLTFLTQRGMVERETRGTSAYYRVADPSIYRMCDTVVGVIARQHERLAAQAKPFTRTSQRSR